MRTRYKRLKTETNDLSVDDDPFDTLRQLMRIREGRPVEIMPASCSAERRLIMFWARG